MWNEGNDSLICNTRISYQWPSEAGNLSFAFYLSIYKMNGDDCVDIVKAERYRVEAEAFELFRKDSWENGREITTGHYMTNTKGKLVKLMRLVS